MWQWDFVIPRRTERLEPRLADEGKGQGDVMDLETRPLAERIAELAWEKKALDLRVLRVLELVSYTDWFIVMSARSDRHAGAICSHLEKSLRAEENRRPLVIEGIEQKQWIVMDYGDVVVHIFYEPVRFFYDLEKLWSEAPELVLSDPNDVTTDTEIRAG
jgi:ribosome-associated protein